MAEAGGEAGGGESGDGLGGIEAAIEAIENAAAGSISMGLSGEQVDPAAGYPDLGIGVGAKSEQVDPAAGYPDLGIGANVIGGARSELTAPEGGFAEGGGEGREAVTPAPEKPKAQGSDAAPMATEERRQRNVQRAAGASVTRNDNDAYLLGYTGAKRKDARRTLLGS